MAKKKNVRKKTQSVASSTKVKEEAPKTMTIDQIKEKAASLGIKTHNLPLAQFVRDIQLAEGHKVCFDRSGGQCSEMECPFRDHCLKTATSSAAQAESTEQEFAQQQTEQAATVQRVQQETQVRKQENAAVQASQRQFGQGTSGKVIEADITQEMADIFSMVKNLEAQVETSTKLNEDLHTNFAETQERLAEESATRNELEERMKTVEEQAAQADSLSKDIAYTENERQKLSRLLADSHQQLQALTGDYEMLNGRVEAAEVRAKNAVNLQKEVQQLQQKLESSDSQIENMQRQVNQQNNDMMAANETLQQEIAKRKKSEEVLAAVKERLKGLSL